MSNKNDGGTAFPVQMMDLGSGPEEPSTYGMGGMSLRDYFAGKALAGLMGNIREVDKRPGQTYSQARAQIAYAQADAMIQERVK